MSTTIPFTAGSFYTRALAEYRSEIRSVKQVVLAAQLGVSQARVSQMTHDKNPTIKRIDRVLAAVAAVKQGAR